MARQKGSTRSQRYGGKPAAKKPTKKYASGGTVRGGGAARRGLKFSRSC